MQLSPTRRSTAGCPCRCPKGRDRPAPGIDPTQAPVASYPHRMDSDQPIPADSDLVLSDESTASVLAVWRSLTDKHIEWWPDMKFEAIRGASLCETWTENGVEYQATGHVVEVQDGTVLAFNWSEPAWPAPLSVRFELEQIAAGTRISVRECGFNSIPNGHAVAAAHHGGWRYHLAQLRSHAER